MPVWLASPITKYLTLAVLVMSAISGSYLKGRSDGDSLCMGELAEQRVIWMQKVNEKNVEHRVRVSMIAEQYRQELAYYREQVIKLENTPPEVITRTVRVYIPEEVDTHVPDGFVEMHNKAARGLDLDEVPINPTQQSDKKLSDVSKTVAVNYYNCSATRAQLIALQNVVKQYQDNQKELIK